MTSKTLIKKIELLPDEDKAKLEGIVDTLLADAKQHLEGSNSRKPVFGSGKGMFGEISDDFDEPLEDFKDYM